MKKIIDCPNNKQIYTWNILGSGSNAAASIVLLLLVTRILGEGDVFSIAWAISQLALTVGTFQVRPYQSTDVKELYKFKQYLIFRLVTVAAMGIYSVIYVFIKAYAFHEASIILIVCVVKMFDALSDVFQGWFQQKERLDLAGKVLTFKVVLSIIFFGLTLFITKNLLFACIAMLVVNVIGFFIYDYRYYLRTKSLFVVKEYEKTQKWMSKLMFTCLPLFVNAFIIITIFNAPKMAVDSQIKLGSLTAGAQTHYNILFMPASVMNLIFIFFRPLITKMAIVWENKNKKDFFKIMRNIFFFLTGIAFIVIFGGWLIGIPILSSVYGVNLSGYEECLIILLLGGVLNTFVNVLDNALTVIRKQFVLAIAYIITWVYSSFSAPVLVSQFGLKGASYSFLSSMFILLICTAVIFTFSVKSASKKDMLNE